MPARLPAICPPACLPARPACPPPCRPASPPAYLPTTYLLTTYPLHYLPTVTPTRSAQAAPTIPHHPSPSPTFLNPSPPFPSPPLCPLLSILSSPLLSSPLLSSPLLSSARSRGRGGRGGCRGVSAMSKVEGCGRVEARCECVVRDAGAGFAVVGGSMAGDSRPLGRRRLTD